MSNETVTVKKSNRKSSITLMTELAFLTAIIFIMAFTPLGYLRVGIVQITFIVVPVAVGAVLLGVKAGAFLGLMFGLSSLLQPESLAMVSIIPVQVIVTCIVPRIFVGIVPALVYKGLGKLSKKTAIKHTVNTAISCVLAPLTNTVLYVGFFVAVLGQYMAKTNPDIWGVLAGKSFFAGFGIFFGLVAVNAVVEAISCLFIATAICNALWHTVNKSN